MSQNRPNDPALQVAAITARQAIVVAVITSVAGLVGAYIGNRSKDPAPGQHHIRLTGVRTYQPGSIRVVFEVNGQAYSYPSRVVWADVSETMSQESFPLPSGASSYTVHVSGFLRDESGGTVEAMGTQEVSTYPASTLPVTGQVRLSKIDHEFNRGVEFGATVSYSLY